MIDFTQETDASLRQEMLDRVPDTYDKRDTAPIPTAISTAAYTLAGFYLTLDRVQRAAFVQTAVGDSLDMACSIPLCPLEPGSPPSTERAQSTLP